MRISTKRVIAYLSNLHRRDNPTKETISLLLQATGLSKHLVIKREGYNVRFCSNSALARSLWISPSERMREERFVRAFLKPGDTLVDVGANIGTVTFAGAARVGAQGRVIAVEPHPRTFKYLVENGKLNNFKNIQYRNCALGASKGVVGLSDKGDDDQNRIVQEGIPVEMTRLDDLLQEMRIAAVTLLKIDVEGFEKQVLEGARNSLEAARCVYIETLEQNLMTYGARACEVLQLLKDSGFRLFQIEQESEDTVGVREPSDLPRDSLKNAVEIDITADLGLAGFQANNSYGPSLY